MAIQLYNWATGNQDLEEDLNLMRNKAKSLIARATDISTEVRSEELHPRKKRKREVDNWIQNAQKLHLRIERIEEEVVQGVTSNRHRLRDQILQIIKDIEELQQQGTFPNGLVIQDIASSSLPLVTTDMKGQQFDNNLRLILSWLKADEVDMIGVYGVGGVGKTTLATHIHNQLVRDLGKCASVCWVTVSKDCTISELQDKIVKALDQPQILDKADVVKRPAILYEALKKRSSIVVILDDMWKPFPVEEVGLPIGEHGCKLLLTTRSLDVCQRMECQESVKVESLSKEESWSLFVEKLGNYDGLSVEAKVTANLVAEECAGLPLGIKVVAASMRGVFDDYEWNNTLEELRNPTRIHEGMENEVFPSLQLSYSRLNDVMLQKCFLSCALYPEDSVLGRDKLVNLWIMEGHLEGIQSRQKQLDKAHSMLNRLVSACLLDPVINSVKMHDLIRDMAIWISSQRDHVMIKAGIGLQEVPRLQEWTKELTKVSLVYNKITEIPEGMTPICPNLSCLLFENNPMLTIPDSFLMSFNGLKFLDLSSTKIQSVPNSVSDLENLSALNLDGCNKLVYVPSLEKLTKLRHLDLRSCWKIRDLPKGMEKLVNLECLCLHGCMASPPVTFNQLTLGLSNIQCLELSKCVEDAQITDIEKLRYLERLVGCVGIHDSIGNFNKYVRSQHFLHLTSYHLRLGRTDFDSVDSNRAITIGCFKFEGGAEPVQLPHNIQELEVYDCDFKVRSLADALPSLDGLTSLESITIFLSEGIECIWSESSCAKPTLENLEQLRLDELNSLRGLAIGRVELPRGRGGAFSSLKRLSVCGCNRVEKLFTPCLLNGQLRNLEEIRIQACDVLEEMFAGCELDDESGDATIEINTVNTIISLELPKLRLLHLSTLPRLVSICKTGLLCCKSVGEISVRCCPELKKLCINVDEELGNGKLRIELEREWWESLVWDNPQHKHTLDPFVQFVD